MGRPDNAGKAALLRVLRGEQVVYRYDSEKARALSRIPGRLRVHLGADGDRVQGLAERLRRLPGVESVQANPLTGNLLVRYDHRTTRENDVLSALDGDGPAAADGEAARRPAAASGGGAGSVIARVGLRAVLGHAAVDSLWFAAGFLGQAVGLPLAGLGPLHVAVDVLVWGSALASVQDTAGPGPGQPPTPRSLRRNLQGVGAADAR